MNIPSADSLPKRLKQQYGWIKLKPKARNSTWVFHFGPKSCIIICCFFNCTNRELIKSRAIRHKTDTLLLDNSSISNRNLTHCTSMQARFVYLFELKSNTHPEGQRHKERGAKIGDLQSVGSLPNVTTIRPNLDQSRSQEIQSDLQ